MPGMSGEKEVRGEQEGCGYFRTVVVAGKGVMRGGNIGGWKKATRGRRRAWGFVVLGTWTALMMVAAVGEEEVWGGRSKGAALMGEHRAVFEAARRWTDTFEPPAMTAKESEVEIGEAKAAGVLIRRSGRLLGSGTDAEGGRLMLRRAVGRALNEAMSDARVAALPADIRESVGRMLTVQVELAGDFVPLVGRTLEQMCEGLQPGIDGLAVRRGGRMGVMFPAQMLAVGTAENLAENLLALGLSLELPLRDLQTPARMEGVSFYSFRCESLAQAEPEGEGFYALRLGRREATERVTKEGLVRFVQGVMRRMGETISSGEGIPKLGLSGTYNAVSNMNNPLFAAASEQALAAYALGRAGASTELPGETRAEAVKLAREILRHLAAAEPGEPEVGEDAAACAAVVLAKYSHHEVATDGALAELFASAANVVAGSFDGEKGFVMRGEGVPGGGGGVIRSPNTRGMLGMALVMLWREGNENFTKEMGRAALDWMWEEGLKSDIAASLPWLGWAEEAYSRLGNVERGHTEELRKVRAALSGAMVKGGEGAAMDLVGGLALQRGSGARLADSQTMRPAAWMLGAAIDAVMTREEERAAAKEEALAMMGFVQRLAVGEECSGLAPNYDKAAGGVRGSMWTLEQPVAAQGMAILCAVEALKVLGDS